MRKSFTLLILSGFIGAGVYALAKDNKTNISTTSSRGLTTDCNQLLKDHERIAFEVDQLESRLAEFKKLSETERNIGFANRANAWCKSVLYSLGQHAKQINNKYQHCTCEAGKIAIPADLKLLLEKVQQGHILLNNRIIALKTLVSSFQVKMQANLN